MKENLKVRGFPSDHIDDRDQLLNLLEFAAGVNTHSLDAFCDAQDGITLEDEDDEGYLEYTDEGKRD